MQEKYYLYYMKNLRLPIYSAKKCIHIRKKNILEKKINNAKKISTDKWIKRFN